VRTLPPGHDIILYDGACGFCRRSAERLQRALPPETTALSFRDAGVLRRYPAITVSACESAIQLIRKDGTIFAGAEALVQALRVRWYGAPLRALYYLPAVRQATDAIYGEIARRRFMLST
jgi:predicted DCC family thiol-disulfide oxidoreductase YuxK